MIADPVHPSARPDIGAPRATVGCIQLPTDLTLDEEGPALVSRLPGVRLRLQKLELDGDALDGPNYETARGRIERAARTLRPADSLDALGLACTSLAFTLGREAVGRELRGPHPHAEVTDMASAMRAALRAVGARRAALLTPYGSGLHRSCVELLEGDGCEVLAERSLGLASDAAITAVSPGAIAALCREVDDPRADVMVICCSAFRACGPGFIDELERVLAKTVITSQQAFLWDLLRRAGVDDAVGGYGRLLRMGRVARPMVRTAGPHGEETPPDVYPSRVRAPGLVERVDPVVCDANRARGPLPEALVDRFDRRGAVVLPGVFGPEEVQHLREGVEDLRRHYEALPYEELDRATDMRVVTERGGTLVGEGQERPALKSIWQIHLPPEHAPHLRGLAELSRRAVCDARLVDAARQLLGDEVYVHQSRINFQRGLGEDGLGGSGFLWHQDFEQWHCEDGMPRMRALSMAVLLEPAVPANGALMVMPGSHRRLVQARAPMTTGTTHTTGGLSRGPRLPVEHLRAVADEHGIEHCVGEAGDVVLFDCNVMHGSHTNISPWGRCMLFTVYNAVSNTPAPRPYFTRERRPEPIGSHDPRFCGVPLPSLVQSLAGPLPDGGARDEERAGHPA